MNGTSDFLARRSSTSDHQRIGSDTSNGIDSEKVPGAFSVSLRDSHRVGHSLTDERYAAS